MLRTVAIIYGIAFVIIGILGFVPSCSPNNMLLGIFQVNAVHNFVHLITGIIAFIVGFNSARASQLFFQIFGILYAVVAILGFFYADMPILGLIANNMADTWFHLIIALISLIIGFGTKRASHA